MKLYFYTFHPIFFHGAHKGTFLLVFNLLKPTGYVMHQMV